MICRPLIQAKNWHLDEHTHSCHLSDTSTCQLCINYYYWQKCVQVPSLLVSINYLINDFTKMRSICKWKESNLYAYASQNIIKKDSHIGSCALVFHLWSSFRVSKFWANLVSDNCVLGITPHSCSYLQILDLLLPHFFFFFSLLLLLSLLFVSYSPFFSFSSKLPR